MSALCVAKLPSRALCPGRSVCSIAAHPTAELFSLGLSFEVADDLLFERVGVEFERATAQGGDVDNLDG